MGDPTGRQPRGNSCSRTANKKYDASFTTVKEAPQPMPSTGPFVAIETSSSPGSVAVGTPPDDLREFAFPAGSDHGRGLIPALVTLTEAAGWPLAETTLVSVAIGPGPFTGLRVGVTTAKAIAWSTGCPVAAIPTATCLAAQAVAAGSPKGPVQVVFDAGRGELFVVTASPAGPPGAPDAGNWWQLHVTGLQKPEAWRDSLPRGAAVTGSGLALADPLLTELPDTRPDLWIAAPADRQPTASTVARLGLAAAERNELFDAVAVKPIYLRASYAEEKKG
jgi:tRNA threonylcarbamoyladenosine biosynthesis protein TsaB